ncbi:ABC transporter permease [Alloacidobacterium dinghuense]|uniref:ABC transporter permease n=1 Tax=Alloacidobacterium dinghuense TaxID=2763107 RepID=A0A7G8BGU4_9BACT|nr:ABC transporter permease [Alloacidobacterium dinghuense]QNI31764.1 ABC transporter permease [Alloacidobacterium dinghuense]
MTTLLQDIRYAVRQLWNHPGFSLTAILSLALGIGATVSVFSIIYAVLMNPWPYTNPERIASIALLDKSDKDQGYGLNGPQSRELAKAHSLEYVVAFNGWNLTITGSDVPEDVQAMYFTGNLFQMLGVPALYGRYFVPADAPDGQDPQPVIVLSNKFWRRHYNGDPSVVGKTIQLVHKTYTVIGIMPPRFGFFGPDVYLPLKLSNSVTEQYGTMVKLRPDVTQTAAAAELQSYFQAFSKQTPDHFPKQQYKIEIQNLNHWFSQQIGKTLYLLFGAVGLLLAIGCGNVSILLLARGTARQHEFAVRSAVGASSSRIIRQLLTESLLIALTGAGLGVILAYQSLGLIVARLPRNAFPNEADFHVHLPVLLFSVGLAMVTGILFGLFPALQLARPEINQVMQSNTRKVAGTVRGKQLHSYLIAGQIALTLLLLTAAGAAIEGFVHMMRVNLGYNPHNTMSVGIPVHENTFSTWTERVNYFEQLRQKIGTLPDVISTGISTNATPPDSGWEQPFELLGKTAAEDQKASINLVDSNYFSTLQIPLRQGRLWDATETAHGALLVVVNETFAKHYYPTGSILSSSVKIPSLKNEPPNRLVAPGSDGWLQIIGVTADVLDDGLDKPVKPAIYLPYSVNMWMWTQVLVRSRVDPRNILHSVKQQIVSVNPDQQATLWDDGVLETWIHNQTVWARGRLISILFAAFSILALALAAVGLYSVVSYSVVQRTNEFGIRMALGAQRWHVLKIVFASAGVSIGLGIGVGLALSLGLNRMITRWIETTSASPLILLAVSFLLLVVAALACLLPARRASAVDPMTALRCE